MNSNHKFYSPSQEFRGFIENREVEIIFDEVPLDQIRMFFDAYLRTVRGNGKILGVVSVGSQ